MLPAGILKDNESYDSCRDLAQGICSLAGAFLRLTLFVSLLWCRNALVECQKIVACVSDTRMNEEEEKEAVNPFHDKFPAIDPAKVYLRNQTVTRHYPPPSYHSAPQRAPIRRCAPLPSQRPLALAVKNNARPVRLP